MTMFMVAITICSIHQPEDVLLSLIMAVGTFPGRYYTTLLNNPGSVGRSFFPCGSNSRIFDFVRDFPGVVPNGEKIVSNC